MRCVQASALPLEFARIRPTVATQVVDRGVVLLVAGHILGGLALASGAFWLETVRPQILLTWGKLGYNLFACGVAYVSTRQLLGAYEPAVRAKLILPTAVALAFAWWIAMIGSSQQGTSATFIVLASAAAGLFTGMRLRREFLREVTQPHGPTPASPMEPSSYSTAME
jgi:hypothetical protein